MTMTAPISDPENADSEAICSTTTIAALHLFGAQFTHRQFNSAELSVLSGIGRTALSQIKNASDTPFSLGKCTLKHLDRWLAECDRGARWRSPWAAGSLPFGRLRAEWLPLCGGRSMWLRRLVAEE